jgi:hypothetical protein
MCICRFGTDRVDTRYHSVEPSRCRARAKEKVLYVPMAAHLFPIFRSTASLCSLTDTSASASLSENEYREYQIHLLNPINSHLFLSCKLRSASTLAIWSPVYIIDMADYAFGGSDDETAELKKLNAEVVCRHLFIRVDICS